MSRGMHSRGAGWLRLLVLCAGSVGLLATPSSAQVRFNNYMFADFLPEGFTDHPVAEDGVQPLFRITTIQGDPFHEGDENTILADLWLVLNSSIGSGSVLDEDGTLVDFLIEDLNFPDAEVTRDLFRFKFTLRNLFSQTVSVQPQIFILNRSGSAEGFPDNLPEPPFSGPTYSGRDLPRSVTSFSPLPAFIGAQVTTQTIFRGQSDQSPQRVLVPNRVDVNNDLVAPGFWVIQFPSVTLLPNQRRDAVVYFGLGWASGEYEPPYVAAVTSRRALRIASATYSQSGFSFPFHFDPEPFVARLGVFNLDPLPLGDRFTGAGGTASIVLPEGLRLEATDVATKAFPLVDTQRETFLGWNLIADNLRIGPLEYQIVVTPVGPPGIQSKVIRRQVMVPALPWHFFPAAASPSDPTGIDFVGFPFLFDDRYPPIALGLRRDRGSLDLAEDELTGRFATYLPDRRRYAIFDPVDLEPEIAESRPGRAFWISLAQSADMYTLGTGLQARPLLMDGFEAVDPRREFEVFLDSRGDGWNGVSPPYLFPIHRGTILVVKDFEVFTLQEAISRGFIRPNFYFWDRRIGAYRFSDFNGLVMLPYRGYFVRALRDVFFLFQPIPAEPTIDPLNVPVESTGGGFGFRLPTLRPGLGKPGPSFGAKVAAARDRALQELQSSGYVDTLPGGRGAVSLATKSSGGLGAGWRLRLVASSGRLMDPDNFIGMFEHALDGFGPEDVEKPPPVSASVSLRFPSAGFSGGLAADYRRSIFPRTWTLEVRAPRGGGPVTLDWRGLEEVPSHIAFDLVDRTAGRVVSLRQQPAYAMSLGDGESRTLYLTAKTSGFGGKRLAPGGSPHLRPYR